MSTARTTAPATVGRIALATFWEKRKAVHSDPWTNAVSIPAGAPLAWVAYRLGLKPNHVTLSSLVTMTAAALGYALLPSGFLYALLIAIAFQFGYALDCADGQLARATGKGSAFGQWLDVAIDYASTIAIPAAMSWYATAHLRTPYPGPTALAAAAMMYTRVLCLFTSSIQRRSGNLGPQRVSALRFAFRLVSDSGIVMIVIVAVRQDEMLMLACMCGYALISGVRALGMARRITS